MTIDKMKKYIGKTFRVNEGLFTPTHYSNHPEDKGNFIGKLLSINRQSKSLVKPVHSLTNEVRSR